MLSQLWNEEKIHFELNLNCTISSIEIDRFFTLFRDNKMLDMEEVRRRNLNNRKITQEEILEAEEELKNGALYTESWRNRIIYTASII